MANLRILGDLAPLGKASEPFFNGEVDWFLAELMGGGDTSIFTVVNLECPIVKEFKSVPKVGPSIGIKSLNANALRGFSLVSLANNHILDHGEQGLSHTMEMLDEAGVPHVGAGRDIDDASKPHVAEIDGIRVGFLAWSHHEFCIASSSSAGACPIDLTMGLKLVEELRQSCEFVILFYHGGVEHFPYPTPEQRKTCRFLAERGVDLIVCQHSHIIGASELVGDSTILYGQGNYCFDLKGKESFEHWNQGLMLDVDLEVGRPLRVDFVPIVQGANDGMRPRLADPETSAAILEKQKYLSETLSDLDDFEQLWSAYAEQQANHFLYGLLPVGRYVRKALKIFGLMPIIWGKNEVLRVLNRMECEAHSDVIVAGLKNISNRRKNK